LRAAWTQKTSARSSLPTRSAWPILCSGFGGFVAKYLGDGVLVYFGYPQAHEDDAERAGLELIQAVAD
jgi:class 3 adenylate cyclase